MTGTSLYHLYSLNLESELDRRTDYRRFVERMSTRNRDRVWRTIESTPNFWTTLKPLEDGAVTIRDRDSMSQERVPIADLVPILNQRLAQS